jgi:hypothetical protein
LRREGEQKQCLAGAPLKPAMDRHRPVLTPAIVIPATDLPVEVAKAAGVAVAEATVDHPIVIADEDVREAEVLPAVATATAATVHLRPDPGVVIARIVTVAHRRLEIMMPGTIGVIGVRRHPIPTTCVIGTVRPHRSEEARILTFAVDLQGLPGGDRPRVVAARDRLRAAVAVARDHPRVAAANAAAGTKDRLV